jgi:hypothetical protein
VTSTKDTPVPAAPPGEAEIPIDQYQAPDLSLLTDEQQKLLGRLAAPFDPDEIEILPKPYKKDSEKGNCRVCNGYHGLPAAHLSYVGHAGVTMRLTSVDPTWTWRPLRPDVDERALAAAVNSGNPELLRLLLEHAPPTIEPNGGIWIRLQVAGIERLGFGDADGRTGTPKDMKEMIGDAIRNGAMRMGVGTYLWSKSDRAQAILARQGADDERVQQEDRMRQELPKGRPAQRAKGTQAKAQAQEDPWKTIPLRPEGVTALTRLCEEDDLDEIRKIRRDVLADGKKNGPQHVTFAAVELELGTDQPAREIGMEGPLDLLLFADKLGPWVKANGISLSRYAKDLADEPDGNTYAEPPSGGLAEDMRAADVHPLPAGHYAGDTGLPGEGGEQS